MKSKILLYLVILLISSLTISAQVHSVPKVEVLAFSKLKNGQSKPVVELTIQEFLTTKIYALLNYVFFDENTADIPAKYFVFTNPDQTISFDPENQFLNWEILDVYYNILNIIGYRLKMHQTDTISLQGCNSNRGAELNNLGLSARRAARIRDYLVSIWGIDSNRIKLLEPRNLPLNPSFSKEFMNLTDEENRRVEINGSWDILKPLIVNDTQRVASPPAIIFQTNVESSSKVNDWRLIVQQKLNDLRKPFIGMGIPSKEIIWRINKNKEQLPTPNFPITFRLIVNAEFQGQSNIGKIPVKEINIFTKRKMKIRSKEYSRYNLILFDYSKSDLSANNKKILDLIKQLETINDSTKIFITGYTDTVGTLEINQKLSKGRADEAFSFLENTGIIKDQMISRGLGNTSTPYYKSAIEDLIVNEGDYIDPTLSSINDENKAIFKTNYNQTPEGRFYCRTVVIEIENQIIY